MRGLRALAIGLLLWPIQAAAQQGPIRDGVVREGTLSFDGRASLGDFTGKTTTVSGELRGAPEIARARGWVEAPVESLKTGKGKRDRDLNKSMESDKYPSIRFELDSVGAGSGPPDSLPVTLFGRLTLHGETREVALPSILSFLADGVRARTTFPVNLKKYRIGGLSKALGILKMHEDIVVHVDVLFAYS
jgi:polyisoprenoid-binding protein YceI